MTSYVTPKKNAAFIIYVSLEDQANPGLFKASPTLAAGDFKVAIDGGSLTNLTTLPTNTPAASKMVKISLSADEMNGDNITVVCSDAAGAEWYDLTLNIQTSARQIDDLATPTNITAGTITTVTNGVNVAQWAGVAVAAATVGGYPKVDVKAVDGVSDGAVGLAAIGERYVEVAWVDASVNAWAGDLVGDMPATVADLPSEPMTAQQTRDAMKLAPTAGDPAAGSLDKKADDILEDTGTTLPGLIGDGGLTAQEVANAALLTPMGVAAAGSQMAKLDEVARPGDPMTIARRP